jgi:copper(I)-binding protein
MKLWLPTALLALALATQASAAPVKAGDLTIENAWARATPKGAPVGAGYVTIKNDGATADKLIGASADFASVQVHEMKMDKGVMQMREVTGGLDIPAHQTVTLKPSGYHLMLMDLKHPLVKGETAHLTLTFEHAGAVAVDFPVAGVGAAAPAQDMKGMKGMKM